MSEINSVFLSYCWSNRTEAEQIYNDLKAIGVPIKMDAHEVAYKDDLKSFMKSIRTSDYAILLISDDYLKSVNCMYEVSHLLKEQELHRKVLPVIMDSTSIFKPKDRIKYIRFWEKEKETLNIELSEIAPVNALEVLSELKSVTEIVSLIDGFLGLISSMLVVRFSKLRPTNYITLLRAMGFQDVTYLTDLLAVSLTENINKRELLLDKYITKHQANSYYYTAKAVTYSKAKKFEQAKFNYNQAITLNNENYEALNNLGLLYHQVFNNPDRARELFEKAIVVESQLTVARLNLGVLLSSVFKDMDGAKDQYMKILEYDPTEPSAHNNLGNYYKNSNPDKAESHFKSAIEYKPDYVEAYINYANLLKLKGLKSAGNELYKKALELDKMGYYTNIIELLMKSDKG